MKDPGGEVWGAISNYLTKVSTVSYFVSSIFKVISDNTSWKSSPALKLATSIQADTFRQLGTVTDRNALSKDRVIAAVSLGSNFIPNTKTALIPKYAKSLIDAERSAMISRAVLTGDAGVIPIVQKLYQARDVVPGGTAGALRHEIETGQMLSRTGHATAVTERINWINNQMNKGVNYEGFKLLHELRQDLERAANNIPK